MRGTLLVCKAYSIFVMSASTKAALEAASGMPPETISLAVTGLEAIALAARELCDDEAKGAVSDGCLPSAARAAMEALACASREGRRWPELVAATASCNNWSGSPEAAALGVASACCAALNAGDKSTRQAAAVVSRSATLRAEDRAVCERALAAGLGCADTDLRVATLMSRAFGLTKVGDATAERVRLHVSSATDLPAASSLAAQLSPWTDEFRPVDLARRLVDSHLWDSAADVVESAADDLRSEAARLLVTAALEAGRARQADVFATRFQVPRQLATAARLGHAQSTISKLCSKRQFSLVARVVDSVDELGDQAATNSVRATALNKLQGSCEHALAARLAETWGLPMGDVTELIEKDLAWRREHFLQWPLHSDVPDLVDDPDRLQVELAGIAESSTVGFDVEWGSDEQAAVLQIATLDKVVLLDLAALRGRHDDALALHVAPLFRARDAGPTVGFSVRHDLANLRASGAWFPKNPTVVDLQSRIVRSSEQGRRRHAAPGLAAVAQEFLGKPLDKSEQCGAWEQRPLSLEQRTYAGLDAWVCVAIYDALRNGKN